MDGLSISPLTCSKADADWSIELPPVANASIQQVTIQMTTASSVFEYNDQTKTLLLAGSVKSSILNGSYCPEESEFTLDFLLTSNILGSATHSITIPNNGDPTGSFSSFEGYVIQEGS